MNKRKRLRIKTFLIICAIWTICFDVWANSSDEKTAPIYNEELWKIDDIIPEYSTILSWCVTKSTERAVVHAEIPWEMTSIITVENSILSWSVNQKDFWSFNNAIFPYGHNANGIKDIPALSGYVYPGENLGRLIGRIGDSGRMFSMGTSGSIFIKHGEGGNYIYLTINDELSKVYGPGFNDNSGEILVTIAQKPMPILRILLVYHEKCPNFKNVLKDLKDALTEEKTNAQIQIVKLSNLQEAKNLHIVGSPTIRINNKDIDPSIKKSSNYSLKCRSYFYHGKITASPPKEFIIEAIRKAKKQE